MKNQAINSQELTSEKLNALYAELFAIQSPYHEALTDIALISIPVAMILNTETGCIAYKYDDTTQKIIDDIKYGLNEVTAFFMRKHKITN